jgi:ATP-dependent Zn protease
MTSSRNPKTRLVIAYHEAGHAVAARHTGMRFREVAILSDGRGNSHGHLLHFQTPLWFRPDLDMNLRIRERCETLALISLAGPAAETRFRGRHNWKSASSDMQQALDLLEYLSDSNREKLAYAQLIHVRAQDVVARGWLRVRAVAEALAERDRLTGAEVGGIISASTRGARATRSRRKNRKNTTPTA